MVKEDMEALGYKDIDKASPGIMPSNQLRDTRFVSQKDPLQSSGSDNEYPSPGGAGQNTASENKGTRYRVLECFYKQKGHIYFCVTDGGKVHFKDEAISPYGDRYPVVMGECLLEPHKLIGEGLPEPLEGPQESYNANMNMRKDNIALLLNRPTYVSRFGGVDYQALTNRKTGGVILMDDVDAVKEAQLNDYTQSSYQEANTDNSIMNEMSGVNDAIEGLMRNEKATVAQINLSAGNAKLDLYAAIIGESFIKDFYTQLAYLIQRFETDETVYRIANDNLRNTMGQYPIDIYDIDFEADCIINTGLGASGREGEIKQTMLAWDRAIMSNQAAISMLQMGISPPEGVRMVDTSQFLEEMLPKLGKKEIDKYFFMAFPPPLQQQAGGGSGEMEGMQGRMAPQIGMEEANMLQAGGFGG